MSKQILTEQDLEFCPNGCGQLINHCLCDKMEKFGWQFENLYKNGAAKNKEKQEDTVKTFGKKS